VNAEHVNVLILGAGLSGIGAACHLRRECPDKTFALLEARESIGGTWDLFRYPGIRSDSDMFTLGYSFQPWTEAKSIADGQSILRYVRDTAREYGIDRHIRFGRRATHARWSSTEANWTVEAVQICTGKAVQITCDFLYACTGYYRYDEPYAPRFPGAEHFEGQIIHPQHWPEGLEWAGRRVVVIGSGATAVTLVPALAELAAHVTMLQRSPSYILSVPNRDPLFERLRRHVSTRRAYAIVRWRNVLLTMLNFTLCRRAPGMMRKVIRGLARKQLPAEFDVDTHLNPTYNPWDQRLCLVPDGDLFQSLSSGTASIATGQIDTFVPEGIRLHSGETLAADIVIAATGLNLLFLGGLTLEVDGEAVDYANTIAYKGMMLSGVPNLAFTIGYTNASWTLKADLVAGYVCRLVQQMDSAGTAICVPRPPAASEPSDPIIDLKAGYVLRSVDTLPRQGARPPWRLHQNYLRDVRVLRHGPLDDGLEFRARPRSHTEHAVAELAQRSV
jgi:monooxygenase